MRFCRSKSLHVLLWPPRLNGVGRCVGKRVVIVAFGRGRSV